MFDFVTVTGRRVTIKQMTGREERLLLRASKGVVGSKAKRRKANDATLRALIDAVVMESHPPLAHDELLLGEQFDLLYLIRLASLGPLYTFTIKCPNDACKCTTEYTADLREMKRDTLLCGDSACACHSLRDYDPSAITGQEILAADFSAIDVEHTTKSPRSLSWTLPVSGLVVDCQLSYTHMQEAIGRWMDAEDDRLLSKALAQKTLRIGTANDRLSIEETYDDLTSYDRTWLRDKLADEEPGVDTAMDVECPQCGVEFAADVEVGGNFFLPKRGKFLPWFGSLLRYQRETGKSLTSWTTHSTNAAAS